MADKKPFDPVAYKNQFNAKKYDRINLMVEKGGKETIKSYAEQVGESLNEFIRKALSDRIRRLIEEGLIKTEE